MRCFIGIFPPREAQQAIHALRPDLPNIRWTQPLRYHITLKFVANLNPGSIPEMLHETEKVSSALPIPCRATHLDGFPNRRRAKVAIVRIDSQGVLESLVKEANFQPHLTVGYVRKRTQTIPATCFNIDFEASEVSLIESRDAQYLKISS